MQQPRSTNREAVVNLAAYRETKQRTQETIYQPSYPDAEQTITEIAKYIVLIAEAIRRPRH